MRESRNRLESRWPRWSIVVLGLLIAIGMFGFMWSIDRIGRSNVHAHVINWTTGQGLGCVETLVYKNLGTIDNPIPSADPVMVAQGTRDGYVNLKMHDGNYLIQMGCPNDSPAVARSWFQISNGSLSNTPCKALVGSEQEQPIDIPIGMPDPQTGKMQPQKYWLPEDCTTSHQLVSQ